MNKMQIICPLVALTIAAAVAFVLFTRSQNRSFLRARAAMIGHDLITTTNSAALSEISPDLHDKLSQLLGSPARVASIQFGDEEPPVGDGHATVRIFFENAKKEHLAIRLQPDANFPQVRVLGFWIPAGVPRP